MSEIVPENPTRATIMVVEDESICQLLMKTYLRHFPVNVVFCPDAETALRRLDEVHPDLILMDVVLPQMDGIEATEAIRHRAGCAKIPIVITTTLDNSVTSIEAREAGATGYVVKPLQLGQVRELLDRYLDIGAAGARLARA